MKKTSTITKIERVLTDQLFLPFLVCQVSNAVELLWDTCQTQGRQCRDKTNKVGKIVIFRLISEVFDEVSGFFRPKLNF